jgi:hypothetical protein
MLPLLIKKHVVKGTKISTEYFDILYDYMSNLTYSYFRNEQYDDSKVIDLCLLFVEFSQHPNNQLKDAVWLMSKWRFMLPNILYYLQLKRLGIELPVDIMSLTKNNNLVAQLQEISTIKAQLEATGKPVTRRNILIAWLDSSETSPAYKTLLRLCYTLEHYSQCCLLGRSFEKHLTREEILSYGTD